MPPVVVAAGIGAVGAIGGGLLASSAQKKAAGQAADTSLAVAEKNNALQREIYAQNAAYLSPYANRGNAAGDAINALLGIGGTSPANYGQPPTGTTPTGTTPAGTSPNGQLGPLPTWGTPVDGATQTPYQRLVARRLGPEYAENFLEAEQYSPYRSVGSELIPGQQATVGPVTTATTPANSLSTYQSAFDNYLNSTGYQFQIDQGSKAINQNYAARGSIQSGAAMKALQTYGQETGKSFFKDYLGLLGNQQGVGLAGASAIAGVGSNYANSVSANNNSAGSAAAAAQLSAGQANANLYGTIGNSIGSVANAFGSSYGGSAARNNALAIGRSGWG